MANNILVVYPSTPIDTIQKYLQKNKYTIKFTKGIYNITKPLLLFSNTNIILEDNAILLRKNPRQIFINYLDPNKNYNYNATENITISGKGILRGNGSNKICSDISLMHCNNIKFEGVTFDKTYKSHSLDLSACSNVTLSKVAFKDRIINPNATYKEEINIDCSYYGGYPYYAKGSKCYNLNHCKNITIDNCNFSVSNVCIGNHYDKTKGKHKNIIIRNCTANGAVIDNIGYFVNLSNVDELIIENNIIKNFCQGIIINVLYNTECTDVKIKGNTISNAKGDKDIIGIYVLGKDNVRHKKINIFGNTISLNNINAKYDIIVRNADAIIKDNKTKLQLVY